ncbi:MAG: methyltransferase domain-containing protein [Planctomycetes bacterium]|nr:methyltransferase domain-containing protein [Planctomycetota bacterium]
MKPTIKIDIDEALDKEFVEVEVGCGRKKKAGRIGIDISDLPGVDIVADIEEGLSFIPDCSVDAVHSRSVLEHVNNFEELMREIIRVLKPDGKAYIYVPHFSSPYFYSDYTHCRPFGLYTFYYFVNTEDQPSRKVPDYYSDVKIRVTRLRLKFRSSFKVLNPFRKLFGRIINLHPRLQEFYEENLCYMFPCHGIEVVFEPVKSACESD